MIEFRLIDITRRCAYGALVIIPLLVVAAILAGGCTDHGSVLTIDDDPEPPVYTVSFATDVQPLLLRSCAFNSCHGDVNPQHDFRVTSYTEIMKVSPLHGRAVIAGDAGVSSLYLAISPRYREIGLDLRMPRFSDTLTTAQQDTIKVWIDEGAADN